MPPTGFPDSNLTRAGVTLRLEEIHRRDGGIAK